MDWLDRISLWAIVLLVIGSSALISGHLGEARPERSLLQKTDEAPGGMPKAEIGERVRLIRNLMESDNPGKAEAMGRELLQGHPYEGEAHMVMGDVFMRKQEPVKAVLEYKEAVDLNPDYIDKKAPLFQGKKVKVAVAEALTEIEKRLRLNPSDAAAKQDRKAVHYLQRKLAGSCS